jgi:hypothetical protein
MRSSPRYYGCRRVGDTANCKLNGNGKRLISPATVLDLVIDILPYLRLTLTHIAYRLVG